MRIPPELLARCWFLAGPTASGKSAVALELAGPLNAEIVAMDSMTLYRRMNIGTDKPGPVARRRVPHHLVDIIEPHEEYSLADYLTSAEAACREILDRGRTPLFVGGTGLYLRGLLRGMFSGPPADWEYRRRLESEAAAHSPEFLHAKLAEVDPQAAQALHPRDTRRIIRALEVRHVTGRPISEQQQQRPLPPEQRPRHVYWLLPPREVLYARVNARVHDMMQAGLLQEVQSLLALERPLSRTARQALGYKEIIDCLEQGRPIEDAVELIQRRTRQFAKRQHTWFRNLEECQALEVNAGDQPIEIAEKVLAGARSFKR